MTNAERTENRWNATFDMWLWLTYGRIPTNNWRKLHGFPLRRKSK